MSEEKVTLPTFNGENFSVWKAKIQTYLISKNRDAVLFKTKPRRSTDPKQTEDERKAKEDEIVIFEQVDKIVKSQLLMALSDKFAKIVIKCNTCKEIWDRLCAVHEQKSQVNSTTNSIFRSTYGER